jgi:hypothetical protein
LSAGSETEIGVPTSPAATTEEIALNKSRKTIVHMKRLISNRHLQL